jgi:hypothetical protein
MCKASAKQTSPNVISAGGILVSYPGSSEKSRRLVEAIRRQLESLIRVPKTQSIFPPRAQRNASRHRGVRQQSRSFARCNPPLRRSPNSSRLCRTVSELRSELARLKQIMGTLREALRCIDTYSYNGGMRSDAEKKAHAQLAEFMTKGF